MSSHDITYEAYTRIFDLATASLSGTIDNNGAEQLEQLVTSDAAARRLYIQIIDDSLNLRTWAGKGEALPADHAETPQPEGTISIATRLQSAATRLLRYKRTLSVAASVIVLATILTVAHVTEVGRFLSGTNGEEDGPAPQETAKPEFVAWYMGAHNAEWLDGTLPERTRLMPGQRLAIEKGLIEIQYRTGAVVVIEGPAEFYVGARDSGLGAKKSGNGKAESGTENARSSAPSPESLDPKSFANSGYLAHGKLVARVEGEDAKGFVVDTPNARIADLGTEFGVEVDHSGTTDSYVYDGEVTLQVRTATGQLNSKHTLTAGTGARVDGSRQLIERNTELKLVRRLKTGAQGDRTIQVAGYEYIGDHSDPRKMLPADHPGFPDDDRENLTDGVVGSVDHSDGRWVGWLDPEWQKGDSGKTHPAIVFDLGEVTTVDAIQVSYLVKQDSGIHAPDRVVVSASDDGETFKQISEHTNFDDRWQVAAGIQLNNAVPRVLNIKLNNRRAHYMRLEFYNDNQWTFLSEVRFLAASTSLAEPHR